MKSILRRVLGGGILLLACAGCGSGAKFPIAHVSGKVTFQGKPLPGGGTISFIPVEEGERRAAGGEIKPDGTYTVSTYSEGDGALVGKHRIEVRQNLTLEPAVWPEVPSGQEPPKKVKPIKEEVRVPEPERIPPVYSTTESPLTTTVEKSTSDLNFDLSKQ